MSKPANTSRFFWITILACTALVNLSTAHLIYLRLVELDANLLRSTWSGMLAFCLVVAVLCFWLMFRNAGTESTVITPLDNFASNNLTGRMLGGFIFLSVLILIPFIKFKFRIGLDAKTPVYDPVLLLLFYYWTCWWLLLLAMTALKVAFGTTWLGGFASASVILGVVYEIMIRFNSVTDYPFTLGWSEGSRYYYAALLFSKNLFGGAIPLSPYHASRYILQSIPFLIPDVGLFGHRLWQFLLWIGLTAGASAVLVKRAFPAQLRWYRLLFVAWLFLYFLRVGVYYHLQVMVIVTVLSVSGKHPWRSFFGIIFASLWAGISRVNWFIMPAMMAIAIYLLETPLQAIKSISFRQWASYFIQPALWVIGGLLAALAAQAAYISLSGNADNARAFTSSFTSDLLWYRLLPNASYPTGIVLGILFVSGPLLLEVIGAAFGQWRAMHPIRWIGLFGMILVLFLGSMIVSVKIGGGGDLHNTDTYAVLLGIIAVYFIGGQVKPDIGYEVRWVVLHPTLVLIAVITPILFLIPALSPYPKFRENISRAAQAQLASVVENIGTKRPILFISERQLIVFGDVHVPLVPDYELVILMEMAMSGNQPYLDRFYSDLRSHRFAAIVAGKQNLGIKEEGMFSEENNAWNSLVSPYILCYYEPTTNIETELRTIQIFTPRATAECTLP